MKRSSLSLGILVSILVLAFTYTNSFTVKGKIVDATRVPVSGASIVVKGTKTGTSSDNAGAFSINIPAVGKTLVISAVGYETVEVQVNDEKNLIVTLQASTLMLQDSVVTTGYATRLQGKAVGIRIRGSKTMNYAAPSIVKDEEEKAFYQIESDMAAPDEMWRYNNKFNTEGYDRIVENRFLKTTENPLSTFSIDVDAASYSNVRRMLNAGQLPPAGAVRIEELINYFTFTYPQPTGDEPFSINTEIANCPWKEEHRIVSIGLQGKKIPTDNLPACNLTFLIDVSGSMDEEDKLPLVKASLKLLTEQLREQDKVSIVVYAGNAGLVLPPTSGTNKSAIKKALEQLQAGGSTAGGQGIQLAYKTAQENFVKDGNNRVILCTDGDFNIGISSDDALERLIEEKRKSGIFLSVLGFGTGNYQDAKMQKLADKGNGNHAYIDNQSEAKKVLVNEFGGTLFTIAKDVKLQIEFNPEKVQGYRLIGYENRMLAKEDFNNDKKDAGELGSGHTVTALYEIIPVGIRSPEMDSVDALRYQKPAKKNVSAAFNGELLNIKLRYKQPNGDVSKLLQHPVMDSRSSITTASDNLRFAAAVAQFGMLLRNSEYKGNSSFNLIQQLATNAQENDKEGYRKEFIEMVKIAQKLMKDVAVRER